MDGMTTLRNRLTLSGVCLLLGSTALVVPAAEPPRRSEGEYFETHIRPLLVKRCYACHSTRAKKREGGLLLDSRLGWQQGGDSGPYVIP